MLATLMVTLIMGGSTSPPLTVAATPPRNLGFWRPRVEVWTNRGDDPYHTGQRARVYMRADRDAYVTVFRVDTDGRVRVLFPLEPWDDGFVRGGHEFEIQGRGDDAFAIDDYPGVGYVFAVAAADPFVYDPIVIGDHWDYRAIANGRVRGDPYVALTDLAQRIVPGKGDDWDYDIVPYYVERRYDYPRFLCYDCHSYASYRYWNPYSYSCVRFRIVVFDDPYYYPYRYYGGTRVVFVRPFRPEPRFIFKNRGGARDDQFVTRERGRPVNDNGRRGVRGADVGGRGSVPVPGARGRDGVGERRRDDARLETPQRRDRPDQPVIRSDAGRRRLPPPPSRPNAEQRSSPRESERRATPSRAPVAPRQSEPQSERRSSERPAERRAPPPQAERAQERRRSDEPVRRSEPRASETARARREPQRPEVRPERSRDESRREAPRAEPRRGRAQADPKSSGKPELRRRRP